MTQEHLTSEIADGSQRSYAANDFAAEVCAQFPKGTRARVCTRVPYREYDSNGTLVELDPEVRVRYYEIMSVGRKKFLVVRSNKGDSLGDGFLANRLGYWVLNSSKGSILHALSAPDAEIRFMLSHQSDIMKAFQSVLAGTTKTL